jgi:hypothetical protein
MEFWTWLVQSGLISGDPNYYRLGRATEAEYQHAIQTAVNNLNYASDPNARADFFNRLQQAGGFQGDYNYYASGQAGAGEMAHLVDTAWRNLFNSGQQAKANEPRDAGGGVTTVGNAPPEEGTARGGVGGGGPDPATQLTILTSNEMAWHFDPSAGKWYVTYGLPGSDKQLVFEADPDQMDSLFGTNHRPTSYTNINFRDFMTNENNIFSGNVSEMQGRGTFEQEYEKVISLALNNGQLPSWMQDSTQARDLLFIAQTEGKSNEWLFEQFAKLPEFKARFPSIEKLMKEGNLTLPNAISGFLEYEAGVTQAVQSLGLTMTDGGQAMTPATVGALIDKGWSLEASTDALKTYKRMQDFAPALTAFNSILAASGMAPLTTQQQWFDFMSGNAPQEFYDAYEASSIQEAATKAGLGDVFAADDAIQAALAGNFTLDTASQAMQQAATLLLRMRTEIDTSKFGLNTDDLIDASLGLAPSSGISEASLFENVNRATLAAQAALQKRSKPFTSFTEEGVPQAQSLAALNRQS